MGPPPAGRPVRGAWQGPELSAGSCTLARHLRPLCKRTAPGARRHASCAVSGHQGSLARRRSC
eukprot:5471063-Lingulodinium_polyedra.AAC.1